MKATFFSSVSLLCLMMLLACKPHYGMSPSPMAEYNAVTELSSMLWNEDWYKSIHIDSVSMKFIGPEGERAPYEYSGTAIASSNYIAGYKFHFTALVDIDNDVKVTVSKDEIEKLKEKIHRPYASLVGKPASDMLDFDKVMFQNVYTTGYSKQDASIIESAFTYSLQDFKMIDGLHAKAEGCDPSNCANFKGTAVINVKSGYTYFVIKTDDQWGKQCRLMYISYNPTDFGRGSMHDGDYSDHDKLMLDRKLCGNLPEGWKIRGSMGLIDD